MAGIGSNNAVFGAGHEFWIFCYCIGSIAINS